MIRLNSDRQDNEKAAWPSGHAAFFVVSARSDEFSWEGEAQRTGREGIAG